MTWRIIFAIGLGLIFSPLAFGALLMAVQP